MLHGKIEHGDSLGNKGSIGSGDIQWITAGNGIIHQEMPKGQTDGLMWGFQLWANLPASHKMMDPRYQDVTSNEIPEVTLDKGFRAKIISGVVQGVKGPVQDIVIDPEYLDVSGAAESSLSHPVKRGHTAFAYVVEGQGYFDVERDAYADEVEGANYFDFKRECLMDAGHVIIFDEGDDVVITTGEKPVRFFLVSGKPIKEPVAWYGPIVMNIQEELRIAFEEYQNGTFIKHNSSSIRGSRALELDNF